MTEILVVEDSKFFSSVIKKNIEQQLGFNVTVAENYAEAVEIVDARGDEFLVCLLDLTLPDAVDGEIVDYCTEKNIPSVVFSSRFSDELRESILAKKVIDYIIKDNPSSIAYLLNLVRRLQRNTHIQALVVDDSGTARTHISNLLKIQMLNVLEVSDGIEALEALAEYPDIKLVITDFNMPGMNGDELIQKIRKDKAKDELVVIGMSTYGNNVLSAKFIKNGANDFIHKPFLPEELLCRVSQNLDFLDQVQELKEIVELDHMTGLGNRRKLFRAGKILFSNAVRGNLQLYSAVVDIDHFKKVNDTYGHDVGDIVIKRIADLLKNHFRREADIVTRMGGEEFCVLMINSSEENLRNSFEKYRQDIQNQEIVVGEHKIKITVSIGVSNNTGNSLDDFIKNADSALYDAKNGGRNKVVYNLIAN
jgi:diguanylate cyclase (GGDEF)-like protein